jgi:hypothetical protein
LRRTKKQELREVDIRREEVLDENEYAGDERNTGVSLSDLQRLELVVNKVPLGRASEVMNVWNDSGVFVWSFDRIDALQTNGL